MNINDIKRVGVVGSGTMGFGIAINFALWGYPTTISDLSDEVLENSMRMIRAALNLFVEGELISPQRADETFARITPTTDLATLAAQSDFITEAIVDRAPDKRALFKTLDDLCPPHTLFASNTSNLVLSDIGQDIARKDKLVLTHYFAPPHIVPGVEVAGGPETSEESYELTCALMEAVKKVPIRLRGEKSGYLINRIQAAMMREALQLWSEGMATAEDIELGCITTFGFRMPHEGPFMHYDIAGIWRWPLDARNVDAIDDPKIHAKMSDGTPWFVDPDPQKFDEAVERRDREYIARLKNLYGGLGE